MIKIEEIRDNRDRYYIMTNDVIEGFPPTVIRYRLETTTLKEESGRERPYWLFYDNWWNPVIDVCYYLNHYRIGKSENTVRRDGQALKLLYAFQDIVGVNAKDFTLKDVENLKIFLEGAQIRGRDIICTGLTSRDRDTINGCLAIYREFLKCLGVTEGYLMEKSTIGYYPAINDSTVDFPAEKYASNYKSGRNEMLSVSRYITREEYARIIKVIRSNPKYTFRDEMIVRLMYQFGLRIGEVLGLTEEDVIYYEFHEAPRWGLYIRNRASDSHLSQSSKSTLKVSDKSQYLTKAYRNTDVSAQKVRITKKMYDDLFELISMTKQADYKHYDEAAADTVNPKFIGKGDRRRELPSDNRYLFVNEQGRVLTQTRWNQILRGIFLEAGVYVDTGVRKVNLSHRFRHGYAMEMIRSTEEKGRRITLEELMKLMRHRSIASTIIYFHLTDSEQRVKKEEFLEEMIDPLLPPAEWYAED